MRHALFAAAIAMTIASPLIAARPSVGSMVDDVRTEAAWHGVEVTRIARQGDSLLVHGIDRFGTPVTLRESCSNSRIDCLPDSATGSSVPHLLAPN